MAVLTENVGRGDLLMRRGVSQAFAVRWTWDQGNGFEPVDLTDWTAQYELRSPDGRIWMTGEAETSADGLAIMRFAADAFTDSEWGSRTSGSWILNGTSPAGQVERLGDGYFYLEG